MKINVLDLEFSNKHFYLQKEEIVEKIIFNNRTLYSKFEKITTLNPVQLKEYQKTGETLLVSLVQDNKVNYITIEYKHENWQGFYALLKHLLKSLSIDGFQAYYTPEKTCFQLFILKKETTLEIAYKEVEEIHHLLKEKSKKSYKIYPNQNLPKNFNIITLPTQKV